MALFVRCALDVLLLRWVVWLLLALRVLGLVVVGAVNWLGLELSGLLILALESSSLGGCDGLLGSHWLGLTHLVAVGVLCRIGDGEAALLATTEEHQHGPGECGNEEQPITGQYGFQSSK